MKFILALVAILITNAVNADGNKAIRYDEFQYKFMQAVSEYSIKYTKAENELQKSALVTERFEKFKKLKGDPRHINGWMGVLESMGTNGDGKAYITVRLSPKLLTVSTWNNALSDYKDKTLIPQSSPVFTALAKMKPGNFIKFSGQLKRPTNLTEQGKMQEPDFLFAFSSIEKIADSPQAVNWADK